MDFPIQEATIFHDKRSFLFCIEVDDEKVNSLAPGSKLVLTQSPSAVPALRLGAVQSHSSADSNHPPAFALWL